MSSHSSDADRGRHHRFKIMVIHDAFYIALMMMAVRMMVMVSGMIFNFLSHVTRAYI